MLGSFRDFTEMFSVNISEEFYIDLSMTFVTFEIGLTDIKTGSVHVFMQLVSEIEIMIQLRYCTYQHLNLIR